MTDEIQNDLTDEDKAASTKAHAKRPPLNFYEMGLQKGDVLIWKDDPSISVTILSEHKVCYQGEETSISALSAKLKGYKIKYIQPTPHWLFNDRLLSEVYDETYPFEEWKHTLEYAKSRREENKKGYIGRFHARV